MPSPQSATAHVRHVSPADISHKPSSSKRAHTASGSVSPRKAPRTSFDQSNANGSRSTSTASSSNVHTRNSLKPSDTYTPKPSPVHANQPLPQDDYQLDPTQAAFSSNPASSNPGTTGLLASTNGDAYEDITPHASSSSNGTARQPEADAEQEDEEEAFDGDEEGEAGYTEDEREEMNGEGTEAETDDEEEEEDDEEEEDEDEDDDGSEGSVDIGGEDREMSPEVEYNSGAGDAVHSPRTIKKEPSLLPDDIATASGGDGMEVDGAVNVLKPKKKRPARRASSPEDLPAPVLPMITVRLDRALPPPDHHSYLNWNILDEARSLGMVAGWNTNVAEAGPSGYNGGDDAEDVEMGNGEDGDKPEAGMNGDVAGAGGVNIKEGMALANVDPYDALIKKYAHLDEPANKGKGKAKAKKVIDAYDFLDEFIDDSDLQQDAPTHYARTVKEGFFAQYGPVDVIMEEPPKARPRPSAKNRVIKPIIAKAVRARKSLARLVGEEERRQVQIAAGHVPDEEESVYIDLEEETDDIIEIGDFNVDRSIFVSASSLPELLPPYPTFPQPVRSALLQLRDQSLRHKWDLKSKGKFPTELHEPLIKASHAAWQYDLYDISAEDRADNFFGALPSCLPYNTFTLKASHILDTRSSLKLSIKKTIHQYWDFLQKCEDRGLAELGVLVRAGMAEFEEKKKVEDAKYQEAVAAWDAEHGPEGTTASSSAEAAANGTDDLPATSSAARNDADNSGDEVEAAIKVQSERPKKPITRFTLSGEISTVMIQLYENAAAMRNCYPKAVEWRIPDTDHMQLKESTQTTRLNARMMQQFPSESVSGTMLSRQKTKVAAKKQANKDEKPAA